MKNKLRSLIHPGVEGLPFFLEVVFTKRYDSFLLGEFSKMRYFFPVKPLWKTKFRW